MVSTQARMFVSSQDTKTKQFFNASETDNEDGSVSYMKRLLAATLSNILYYRGLFNESDYHVNEHDGVPIRILITRKDTSPEAREVCANIKNCCEAIEKKYLKQMIIGFIENEDRPTDMVEAYTLFFFYNDEGTSMGCSYTSGDKENSILSAKQILRKKKYRQDDLTASSLELIDNLKLMSKSLAAPSGPLFLNIYLVYNDNTPEEFEAPGFMPATSTAFNVDGAPQKLNCGSAESDFHKFKVKAMINTEVLNKKQITKSQSLIKQNPQILDDDEMNWS